MGDASGLDGPEGGDGGDDEATARLVWQRMSDLLFSRDMHDRVHDACVAVDLPHPGALKLLMQLEPGDPPPMRAVAEAIGCDASWVTALVDDLEGPGYVERRISPTDRRVKLVQLTDAGAAAKQRATSVLTTPPKALDCLTPDEIRTLASLLGKLADAG